MAEDVHPQSQPASPNAMLADLFSAKDLKKMVSRHDSEVALETKAAKKKQKEDVQARIDMFTQRRELTPEIVQRAIQRWEAAAQQGAQEVEVVRFPSQLCTDDGRAINSGESDWGRTLVGMPAQVYEIWSQHLRPRGYHLKAYIVDFPEGKPGDVGMFISWE